METAKQVEQWIEEWCQLYPDNIEFNGNKLRSKAKDCVNKMIKFCKDHPNYTKDIIFASTKLYLQQQAERNYDYTKQSTYFISKIGQPSVLENYCEKIINSKQQPLTPDECYEPINDFI